VMSVGDRSVVIGTQQSNVELSLFDEDAAEAPGPAWVSMPQDGAMPPPDDYPPGVQHDGSGNHPPLETQGFQ
jgi:hypothetical protein